MHLQPNVVLSGKYIIGDVLYNSEDYYAYLAKAPTLGEEFIVTEFFPQGVVGRDEKGYITMPEENAEIFEDSLNKFTKDSERVMHLKANRLLGVKEILSEQGTAYVISRRFNGDMLVSRLQDPEKLYKSGDPIIDVIYDGIKSAADEKISILFHPDSIYVDEAGLITFMYNYTIKYDETQMVLNTAKLLYFMTTGKDYEEEYLPGLWDSENKYTAAMTRVLDKANPITTFGGIEELIIRNVKHLPGEESLRRNAVSFTLFIILLVVIALGIAYGVFLLTGFALYGEFPDILGAVFQ